MISIKSQEDIEIMRAGGGILARVLWQLSQKCVEGFNVKELDGQAKNIIREAGGEPSFKGYQGFPASICVSVNDEVVHGLPKNYVLMTGDVVALDCGVRYKGFHTDSAVTVGVGEISSQAKKLISVTQEALNVAISFVKPGVTTGELGEHIYNYIRPHGLGVVRDLVGHGIGRELQEEPMVPNVKITKGVRLEEGMTIAIEPMVTLGGANLILDENGITF